MNNLGFKSEHFSKIWSQAVYFAEKLVCSDADEYFLENCDVKSNIDKKIYQKAVYNSYKQIREELKIVCYGKDKKGFLDFRKISAVLVKTLIQNKMFYFDTEKAFEILHNKQNEKTNGKITGQEYNQWAISNVFINYRFAYLTGVQYVYLILLSDLLEKDETIPLADKLNSLGHLVKYPIPEENDTFDTNIVIGLARADMDNRDIDIFLLSQHFYQLEMYTRQWLENNDKDEK